MSGGWTTFPRGESLSSSVGPQGLGDSARRPSIPVPGLWGQRQPRLPSGGADEGGAGRSRHCSGVTWMGALPRRPGDTDGAPEEGRETSAG